MDFKGNTGKEGRVGDMVRELGGLGEDVGQSNLVNRKKTRKYGTLIIKENVLKASNF